MRPGSETSQQKQPHYIHPINSEAQEHNTCGQYNMFAKIHWYLTQQKGKVILKFLLQI